MTRQFIKVMAKGAISIKKRTTTTITLVMIRHCRSEEGGQSWKEWERDKKGKKVKERGKI
jgi:hypothetical protein